MSEEVKDDELTSVLPTESPYEPVIQERVRAHQASAGRVGGLSRSARKRASSRANLAQARLRRWQGREAAARAALLSTSNEPSGVFSPPTASDLRETEGERVCP